MDQFNNTKDVPERHGLFLLHPQRETYNIDDYLIDIVAIHGLGGHPFKTWTEKEGRHLWLRDSLPGHIPQARILTFGYDSTVVFGKSRSQIHDYAIDLANRLEAFRQHPQERDRPLIFICHSLGGVVFKEFLVQVTLNKDSFGHVANSVAGVVFLGCPHRGSRVASHARLLSRIINAATLGSGARSDLIKLLQVSSTELEAVSRHATYPLKSLIIISFYEQVPTGPSMVVEPFSAILGLPNERAMPVNTDHRGLAHVSPRKPQQYLPVWSSVKELAESCLTPIQADNRKLLEGLFCFDSKSAQMRPRQPQHGTCEWIFSHAKYLTWFHSNEPSMLLLTGNAGSGKSVLARCVAERIQSGGVDRASGSDYLTASYFCSYVEAALNSQEVVLRTLLHQLIQLNPRCGALVRNRLLKRMRTGEEILDLDVRKMWETLREVLSMQTMSHVIVVIDAIEELGVTVAKAILGGLWNIADYLRRTQQDNHLRVFVSSRPNLTPSSKGISGLEILHLGDVDMKADIKLYLSSSINDLEAQNASFSASITPDLREKVITQISKAAGSMFLAAVVTWEDFKRGLLWNQDVVVQKLEKVVSSGSSMGSFYDRLMEKIDPFMLDDALSIFAIISAAARPLSETEIGTILGICRSGRHITRSTDFEPFSNLNTIMEDSFEDLIIVQDDNTVTFIHLSFKDYLISQERFKRVIQKGRQSITKACLVYLKLRDLLQSAVEKTKYDDLASRYPLLPYATSHFYWHINQLPTDDPLWLLFADTAGKYSIYTLESMWPMHRYFDGSPLQHILFSNSIPDSSALGLTRRFHEHGYDLDEKWRHSSRGAILRSCCYYAKTESSKEAALLLLELGANPNLPENSDRTNIGHALENGAWNLYDALLSHPMTDLSARNVLGETLLHHQMQFGTLDRIAELLDLIDEVDLNPQDCEGRTPLHVATMLEKEHAVRMLLARPGIRLNLVDNMGRTPLALATYWGRNKMALTLIEHAGAFPLAKEGHLSALVLAAKRDDKDICNKLLVACQYQNLRFHQDMSGKGILHHAAMNDWDDVIETCVRRGGRTIDIDQIDHSGRSALHYASSLGNIASCQALINGGASLTLQDRLGRTAAQATADAGFKDALLLLLKSGRVDPNQKDSERRNLVHWAATIDCVDVMELISRMPAVKLDQKDCHGKTPIDIAFICQCKYVGLFLASKVPHLNIYSWDLIYRAPILSRESIYRTEELYTTFENDLLMRNAQRQQAAHEEHKELQKQYPPELWALRTMEI
ncbi:Ff.00g085510.m01.CDS01 [Fusarium sp. VM40]|nr:Ff.00g085510.m01.CDS01 [Fusarium sp. VM40]